MTSASKIFTLISVVLISLFYFLEEISIEQQLLIVSPLILLLGLPHGAIDNILFLEKNKVKQIPFYTIYSLIIILNIIIWLLNEQLGYLIFMFISAYHFGQSQFTQYFNKYNLQHKILFFFWGSTILSAMIYFKYDTLNFINNNYSEFYGLSSLQEPTLMKTIFFISLIITIISKFILLFQNKLKFEELLVEFLILLTVLISFYQLPLLVGFTLYFVILHSFKVLYEEYQYLQKSEAIKNIAGFIKLLSPLTLLSLIGIAILYFSIELSLLKMSYGYLLILIISSITLPHIFVMERFYNKLFNSNTTVAKN